LLALARLALLGRLATFRATTAVINGHHGHRGGGCCTDSSRRLKTDISVIGNSPSGIKIYQLRYKRDIVLAGGRVLDSNSTCVDYSKIDVDFYKI